MISAKTARRNVKNIDTNELAPRRFRLQVRGERPLKQRWPNGDGRKNQAGEKPSTLRFLECIDGKLTWQLPTNGFTKPHPILEIPVRYSVPQRKGRWVNRGVKKEKPRCSQPVAGWKNGALSRLAERVGFEPTVPCSTPDFESGTFDHSATSPKRPT